MAMVSKFSNIFLKLAKLNEFLLCFSSPPSIILLSETRMNVNPSIKISIPDYSFIHLRSETKAGGVGAYISTKLKSSVNRNLSLQIPNCEDLWFDVKLPDSITKYTAAVICLHPRNHAKAFIVALDEKMQVLSLKGAKTMILGDINLDLRSDKIVPLTSDYLSMIESRPNAFLNMIDKPTHVSPFSQTTIDHVLSNSNENVLTPNVLIYQISDHFPV